MADKNFTSSIDFRAAFEAMPGKSILLLPDAPRFTIAGATESYCAASGFKLSQLIGKGVFEVFPPNPREPGDKGASELAASLDRVLSKKITDVLEFRYDTPDHKGGFREKYWRTVNRPIADGTGEIKYILHSTEEISAERTAAAQQQKLNDMEQVHNLFMQAPVAIHIFKGPEMVVAFANEPTLKLWNKEKDITGKALKEIFPEIDDSPLFEELQKVRLTGEILRAYERPVNSRINAGAVNYFNYVFQPYYEPDKTSPAGVIAFVNDVTEKVLAEKVLRENETHFQQIANTLPLVVWTAAPDGGLTFISEQWEKYYGNPVQESLGNAWVKFVHSDDVLPAGAAWAHSVETGEDYETEFRVRYLDNTYHWVLVRAVALKNHAGEIKVWYGSNTDIQEQRESEQQIRNLVNNAPYPIGVYTGKDMRITMANQSILKVWGKDESAIGKTYGEIRGEDAGAGVMKQLNDVYTTGITINEKNARRDSFKNGEKESAYFNYSFIPLYDSIGKVYAVMSIAADVTDLNIAQKALQESENNLRNTILKAPVAMCIFRGPDHVVEIANERMMEVWGTVGREVLNRPIFEALPEARDQGFELILNNVYNTGQSYSAGDVPVYLPRGAEVEIVYVTFVFEAYREADKEVSGIIAVAIDVTAQVIARKKIEEVIAERTKELAEANANLHKSNAELAQFAHIASHDLQEPLRKITVFSQMLQTHLGNTDEISRNFLTKINTASSRMINLIRDVLSYSELSKEDEIFKKVDLEEVLLGIRSDFELLLEQKGAVVHTGSLPVIEAVPLQMSQLFGNLISNSLKFSRKDRQPQISISATQLKEKTAAQYAFTDSKTVYYNIEFRDNGIGFEAKHAEQVFNIFQRLHGKTEYSGTGIGLAMCKKIAQNHHGDIFATATDESGAVFNLILPAEQRVT